MDRDPSFNAASDKPRVIFPVDNVGYLSQMIFVG